MSNKVLGAGNTIVLSNLWAGSFLVIFGVAAYAWLIPEFVTGASGNGDDISSGFMPSVAAVSMGVLGVVVTLSAVYHLLQGDLDGESLEDSEENELLVFGRAEIINTVFLIIISIVYVLLLQNVGFAGSSSVILFLLIYATGFRNFPIAIAISVLFPLGLQELLWRVLVIPLPEFPRIPF